MHTKTRSLVIPMLHSQPQPRNILKKGKEKKEKERKRQSNRAHPPQPTHAGPGRAPMTTTTFPSAPTQVAPEYSTRLLLMR